jgi:surface polysaccharide O-acyltransferase-like enzyme
MPEKAALQDSLKQKQINLPFSPDLIRTTAIFLIILVHVSQFPYNLREFTPLAAFNWYTIDVYAAVANMGVPLFVMLTGVLLLDPIKAEEPLGVFFKKRLSRITIPWIFWTIAYFIWDYYVHSTQLSMDNFLRDLLSGYYHLWFLYLLLGLYLATPVLRILIKHIDHQRFKYFIILWVIGSFTTPFIHRFIGINYNPLMFVFIDWIGYYLLGVYLLNSNISKRLMYTGLIGGLVAATVFDTVIPTIAGANTLGFFHEYVIFTIIAASSGLFLILTSIPKKRFESPILANRCLHWIGQNTLPIYLIHVMILETVISALGFLLNNTTLMPIIESPLITLITLSCSAAIVYALKKIPQVGKIIG